MIKYVNMVSTKPMDAKTLLRAHGLKVTPIRVQILAILENTDKPLGIQEIHAELKDTEAHYVSVYRTILTFTQAGIIRTVNLRHGHADYELVDNTDHHHLVCTGCGKIEEFNDCGMDQLIASVLTHTQSFTKITDHALEFFGTCKACAS